MPATRASMAGPGTEEKEDRKPEEKETKPTTRRTGRSPDDDRPLGDRPTSPGDVQFGETVGIYDGEADVASIIKENNMRRAYKLAGKPWPPAQPEPQKED